MKLNDKITKAWDKYLTAEHIDYGYDINPEHFSYAVNSASISPNTPDITDVTILVDERGFHCRFSCNEFKIRPDYTYEAISLINRINDTIPYGKFILDPDYNEIYFSYDCFISVSSQLSNELFDIIIQNGIFFVNRFYPSIYPISTANYN
ncbi:MAG: hypothetical protein E7499_01485 [Ruminococcus sp.]|nr:hypothetical protein [Ruminococcus sp.]